ncbi:hypothetical protein CAC42_6978 [Sphaceloma murrayae]|uniref:Uncharacterized protein n=1 Tax=Sphaceloma murrayae TaxID=2082308 RepID=A0A2K1QQF6_9PEZI|nr:hypothetical protein CAC42_6978 [Sphaceloma murrayae]
MSVTTTQNAATYNIVRTLADYNIQSTEPTEGSPQGISAPNEHPAPPSDVQPENWETSYRRVPAHRPINTELDFQHRNTTLNGVETFFLYNMFTGIQMVQALNRTWRATGGRINTTYFRWQVGGEH